MKASHSRVLPAMVSSRGDGRTVCSTNSRRISGKRTCRISASSRSSSGLCASANRTTASKTASSLRAASWSDETSACTWSHDASSARPSLTSSNLASATLLAASSSRGSTASSASVHSAKAFDGSKRACNAVPIESSSGLTPR